MAFKLGKRYRLSPTNQECSPDYMYIIENAVYVGFYEDHGKISHKFVHIVYDKQYVNYVGTWVMLGANYSLGDKQYEDNSIISFAETHIYQDKVDKNTVSIIPVE